MKGVSVDQIKQTAALVRQSCQPKFKLSDDQADLIRDGNLPDYKEGKVENFLISIEILHKN